MRQRNSGEGSIYKREDSRFWWISYRVDGRTVQLSTKTTKESEAKKFLRAKLAARDAGTMPPEVRPATLSDLRRLLVEDYEANGRRSTSSAQRAADRALERLGENTPARNVGEAEITRHIAQRRAEGAANATINRELAALRRMFRLGMRAGLVTRRPDFSVLQEDNARKGFVERAQLDAILPHLEPVEFRAPALAAYLTGWRVRSELITRQWQHVDLTAGWLRLEPGETKNRRGRMFPLTPELKTLLQAQERIRDEHKAQGRIVPWVFPTAAGEPISKHMLSKAWGRAARKAGLPGKLLHDLRRSAVRNLERAGVPRSTAMAMVGHETESIYRRYAIVDEAMLREGAKKLAESK